MDESSTKLKRTTFFEKVDDQHGRNKAKHRDHKTN